MPYCVACGWELRGAARFCDQCGAAQPTAAAAVAPGRSAGGDRLRGSGELRAITVLLADLVGYTRIAEERSPQEVHEVMRRVFAITDRVITEHGGHIDRHIGDAVMAVFGLAQASDSDPSQATRAALAFQAQIEQLNQTLAADGFPHLALRVGITTGRALVSSIARGDGSEETIVGSTVSLVERLEHLCPPGKVLVSYETYRHFRGLFAVTAQPPILLPDRAEPLQSYVVLEELREAHPLGAYELLGTETTLVGRENELNRLTTAMDRCVAQQSSAVVALTGPAGVGKTRLTREVETRLQGTHRNLHPLRAVATPTTTGQAYFMLREALNNAARLHGMTPQSGRERLTSWVAALLPQARTGGRRSYDPELAPGGDDAQADVAIRADEAAAALWSLVGARLPDEPQGTAEDWAPRDLRNRAIAALQWILRIWTRSGPVVIALDAAHWADAASLTFFRDVAQTVGKAAVLLLVAGRTESAARDWVSEIRPTESVTLAPLSVEHTEQLVHLLLQPVRGVPQSVAETIKSRCGGIPYFAEEIVRSLADTGAMAEEPDGWHFRADHVAAIEVPTTVEALLQARLDRLSRDEREVARAAAVVGRSFWRESVVDLVTDDLPQGAIGDALRRLEERDVVRRAPASTFPGCEELEFVDDLMREIAYRRLLKRKRRLFHRRAAQWLERHAGATAPDLAATLAFHWEEAGELRQARACYLEGARLARKRYANEEAESLYRSYLRLATAPGRRRPAIRVELAKQVLDHVGKMQEALQELRLAQQEALAVGDESCAAMAEALEADFRVRLGDSASARSGGEHALATCRRLRDEAGERQALSSLASVFFAQGDLESAHDAYHELLGLLTRQDGPAAERGGALSNLGSCLWALGRLTEARSRYAQAIEALSAAGDRSRAGLVMSNLAAIDYELGSYAEASAHCQRANAINRETGNRRALAIGLGNLASISAGLGDVGAARRNFAGALEIYAEVGDVRCEGIHRCERARLERRCGGDPAAIASDLATAHKLLEELGDRLHLAYVLCEEGHLQIVRGESAQAALAAALEIGKQSGVGPHTDNDVGRALARLQRAVEAAEQGRQLTGGELPDDIPVALRVVLERR
ncbi:MAG: AAA family ATPase [Candidatus Schekmanbacteria bacterium]|nr:AAA family ATPase [Candidatus Schekmanbacteria bacterium]